MSKTRLCNFGLKVKFIDQKVESFCDDINLVTDDLNDFQVVENVISRFEKPSGAILSRNKKCQALGFGTWKDKMDL